MITSPRLLPLLFHITPVLRLWISCPLSTTFSSSPIFFFPQALPLFPHTTIRTHHYSKIINMSTSCISSPITLPFSQLSLWSFLTSKTLLFPINFQPHPITRPLKLIQYMLQMLSYFCYQRCHLHMILFNFLPTSIPVSQFHSIKENIKEPREYYTPLS